MTGRWSRRHRMGHEAFENVAKGWTPFFQLLRLYLAHFAGQRVTRLLVNAGLSGSPKRWRQPCGKRSRTYLPGRARKQSRHTHLLKARLFRPLQPFVGGTRQA